jgi:hypothetical protein
MALVSLSWQPAQAPPRSIVAPMLVIAMDRPDQPEPDIAAPVFDLQPVRPALVLPEVEVAQPAPAAAGEAGTSGMCDIVGRVSRALHADATVSRMLDAAPAEARSVSEAIILWNRNWTAIADPASGALGRARLIIEATLAELTPPCLHAEVSGPRLLLLPSRHGTTVLVIGSGSWAWGRLLDDAPLRPLPGFFAERETRGDPAPYRSRQQADHRSRIDPQRPETVDMMGEQP